MDQLPVSHSLCDPISKPITNKTCSEEPCAEWFISDWTQCLCGFNAKQRLVYCRSAKEGQTTPNILSDDECLLLNQTKPSTLEKCIPESECPVWTTSPWNEVRLLMIKSFKFLTLFSVRFQLWFWVTNARSKLHSKWNSY